MVDESRCFAAAASAAAGCVRVVVLAASELRDGLGNVSVCSARVCIASTINSLASKRKGKKQFLEIGASNAERGKRCGV